MSESRDVNNIRNARLKRAMNILAKWRVIFAGWQLGTRSADDPECRAVKDHREATIFLRAEATAVTVLLVAKGVFTAEEFSDQLANEADLLNKAYEQRFPGMRATEDGMTLDTRAAETMKGWKP